MVDHPIPPSSQRPLRRRRITMETRIPALLRIMVATTALPVADHQNPKAAAVLVVFPI